MIPEQSSQGTQLDPQVVNLTKAIRQTESGGNFTAQGKSGEYGAYQYTEPTWQKDSAAAGVNVPLQQATPEQQNEVTYKTLESWKKQHPDWNIGNFASAWNAGEGESNAYIGTFSDGSPSIGINKYGVKYDVPAYAKSVATAYQTLKQGGNVQADPNNPSSTAAPEPQPSNNIGQTLIKGVGDVFNTFASPLEGIAAMPVQALAKALGKSDPYAQGIPSAFSLGGASNTPVTPLTPEAKVGDVAQAGSYFLPGSGLASIAGMGALQGAGQAMSAQENPSQVATSGLIGGGIGGALGGISSLSKFLPERIARSFLPGTNAETAQYAVNKGLGTPTKMLSESDKSLASIGSQLNTALEGKGVSYVLPEGSEILSKIASQFPDSGMNADDIANELENLAPLKKKLVDKMINGDITPKELHSLNSSIGKATFKSVFDNPQVRAGKTIGNTAYHTISDILKTELPGAEPLFDEYSKELQLNSALQKAVRSSQKTRMLTLRDLVAFGAMTGITGNPLGGLGGVLAEKALVNPSVNLKAAGLISKLASPSASLASKGVIPPLVKPLITQNGLVNP